ncbi:MAG: poly-gamma-glutamate biosynthesis protein PgsC/CapC [Acidimicrobiia bacterium]
MHDYLFNVEVVRFAFVLGILFSMLQYERRHLTTGSIVVPGYIAVASLQPLVIAATLVNAFLSFWLVNKVLPRWVLLYGRTKFSVLVVLSIGIQFALLRLSPSTGYLWESDIPLFVGVGYVIPALIAHDMARQGIRRTMGSVARAAAWVAVPLWIATLVLPELTLSGSPVGFGRAAILAPSWIPAAVMLSAAAAWGLLHNRGLRASGFVGAAYLGMFAADWGQIALLVAVAIITWALVTRILMRVMILFGRRKFAAMLIVGALLSWASLLTIGPWLGWDPSHYLSLSALALTPLFVPGLMANDMERASVGVTLGGTFLSALFAIPAALAAQLLAEGGTWWQAGLLLAVSLGAGAWVFWPQIVRGGHLLAGRVGALGRWLGLVRPPAAHRPDPPAPGAHRARPATAVAGQ